MSDFDDQFADLAVPLLADRMADSLVLRIVGSQSETLPFDGIVDRHTTGTLTTNVDRNGRQTNEECQIQVLTAGVLPKPDDAIVLPDGTLAIVVRQLAADPDGNYPLLACAVGHGMTSKTSRARP